MSLFSVGNNPTFAQSLNLTPGAVAANTVSDQTFTVKGLRADGLVIVNAPLLETGLLIANVACNTDGVLDVKFWNTTGAPITPANQRFLIYQP